jgi:hypothetical protein
MSKIYSGCAPLHAEPINAGSDSSCTYIPRPMKASTIADSSVPPKGIFFALQDPGRLHWLAANPVTKETPDATMLPSEHSFDDLQAQSVDWFHLETIALGNGNPSVSRLAAAMTSGRIEQLILPRSDRHTRGLRTWQ